MEFAFSTRSILDHSCDLAAVLLTEETAKTPLENRDFASIDSALEGHLSRIVLEERFQGKREHSLLVHTHGRLTPKRILLLGSGRRSAWEPADLRHLAARAARFAQKTGAETLTLAQPSWSEDQAGLQFSIEGLLLGRYRFERYLSDDARLPDRLKSATLLGHSPVPSNEFERLKRRAQIIATAICRARDWVNEPAFTLTPRKIAEEAERLAREHGLDVKVLGPNECRELGMGMYLAVAQGSDEEPRFIHLVHKPSAPSKRVVLVGKGVTFDSGGLSLKPSASMEDMKTDMAGAALVLNGVIALAQLQTPVEVHALAACTENMPSGRAYKLGDILRSMGGKTVEVVNTDAEGRLTLGDALTYAQRLQPDELFDFATLTGACVIGLGPHTAGVMGNTQALRESWLNAARAAGEDMWPLPLPERLREKLKSEVADMKNVGDRWGGALVAGLFLKEFVGETPWLHIDIAGPAAADKEYGAVAKGGTGFGLATLVEYLAPR